MSNTETKLNILRIEIVSKRQRNSVLAAFLMTLRENADVRRFKFSVTLDASQDHS